MRMVDAPVPAPAPIASVLDGPVIILGDNSDGRALADHFRSKGLSVQMLAAGADAEATVAELEHVWQQHPARHLFVMTARDPEAEQFCRSHAWTRREPGFLVPFRVIQRWYQLASQLPEPCRLTLVAATNLGGNFGFLGKVPSPEGGALTGLLKSIYLENERNAAVNCGSS